MFTAPQILELVRKQPFEPFRICMSDGTHFDIPNHDVAMIVTKNYVEVGLGIDKEGIAQSIARLALIHISRIEDVKKTV